MSYPKNTAYSRITKISLAILAAGSALAVASAVIPSTGAWFFDQQSGKVVATTATMGFSVLDDQGNSTNGPIEMRFNDIAPGVARSQSYTIRNTGSLPGSLDVSFSGLTSTGGENPDMGKLSYSVNGGTTFALGAGRDANIYVGQLKPGDSKTVTITLALAEDAGHEWQGVSATNFLGFRLSQVR